MIKIERHNLGNIATAYFEKISQKKRDRGGKAVRNYFIDNFKDIVLAQPCEFDKWIKLFRKELCSSEAEDFKDFKNYMVRQYDNMNKEYGYWLTEELKVNTCPYCNRQYTFTVNKDKKTKPQFDHFYPKSKYPYLALSFYNLIPCCSICNQLKKDSNNGLLHPYYEGFGDDFYFDINHKDYILNNEDIQVKFNFTNECNGEFRKKCQNNVSEFALEALYSLHDDYIKEIIEKVYSYNDDFYDGLIHDFSKIGKSPSEINQLILGNYIDVADNEKRPLSKLTRDLLRKIGLKSFC